MYCTRSRALPGTGRWRLYHGARLPSCNLNRALPPRGSVRPFRSSLPTPLKSYQTPPQSQHQSPYQQSQLYTGHVYPQMPPPPARRPRFVRFAMITLGVVGFGYLTLQTLALSQELEKAQTVLAETVQHTKLIEKIELAQATDNLVVGDDETDQLDWKAKPLTLHGASMLLRYQGGEQCVYDFEGNMTTRADFISYGSNSPPEDALGGMSIQLKRGLSGQKEPGQWKFWGVYDGHAGSKTALVLGKSLIPYVARELQHLSDSELENFASSEHMEPVLTSIASPEIDKAVKTAFVRLDDAIIYNALNALRDATSNTEALSRISPARAGSCALLSMFDPDTMNLHIACTGDSRAVLGRCSSNVDGTYDSWTAVPLSEDQTGFNQSECARIEKEHPGENEIIDPKTGRLLGLAITRGFGDCRWKWPLDALERCRDRFWGQNPRPNYQTPPYLTAEPVVTSTKVQKGDFLILACDGLWDHMSSEDAVKCVEMWIKARAAGELPSNAYQAIDTSEAGEPLPQDWKATPADFVTEEWYAATHLAKNAFGGSRRDLFRSAVSVEAPDSRSVRDDISVVVVFFDGPAKSWLTEEELKDIEGFKRDHPEELLRTIDAGPKRFPDTEK